jgi:hypothetical protein
MEENTYSYIEVCVKCLEEVCFCDDNSIMLEEKEVIAQYEAQGLL